MIYHHLPLNLTCETQGFLEHFPDKRAPSRSATHCREFTCGEAGRQGIFCVLWLKLKISQREYTYKHTHTYLPTYLPNVTSRHVTSHHITSHHITCINTYCNYDCVYIYIYVLSVLLITNFDDSMNFSLSNGCQFLFENCRSCVAQRQ